jgi:hypothetical protein
MNPDRVFPKKGYRKAWRPLLLVIGPLICGLLVYCLVRPIRFELFFPRGSIHAIDAPEWIRSWVPDFLWAFSLGNSILLVWEKSPKKHSRAFLGICFLFACIFECLQYSSILSGTYDPFDILAYLIGFVLSFLIIQNKHNEHA